MVKWKIELIVTFLRKILLFTECPVPRLACTMHTVHSQQSTTKHTKFVDDDETKQLSLNNIYRFNHLPFSHKFISNIIRFSSFRFWSCFILRVSHICAMSKSISISTTEFPSIRWVANTIVIIHGFCALTSFCGTFIYQLIMRIERMNSSISWWIHIMYPPPFFLCSLGICMQCTLSNPISNSVRIAVKAMEKYIYVHICRKCAKQ